MDYTAQAHFRSTFTSFCLECGIVWFEKWFYVRCKVHIKQCKTTSEMLLQSSRSEPQSHGRFTLFTVTEYHLWGLHIWYYIYQWFVSLSLVIWILFFTTESVCPEKCVEIKQFSDKRENNIIYVFLCTFYLFWLIGLILHRDMRPLTKSGNLSDKTTSSENKQSQTEELSHLSDRFVSFSFYSILLVSNECVEGHFTPW